jgi:hypothetical protein
MKIVNPKSLRGYGLSWNLNLFSGPKLTITCGNCEATFEKRVPIIDHPVVICPYCNSGNKLPLVVDE